MKLHLGCGKRNFGKDWIHIDGGDFPHLDPRHKDLTNLHSIKDDSIDLIYASHVIEYFDREEIKEVLKEWRRVLKPGGILRLAVPDFNQMALLYMDRRINLEDILGPLYGKMKMDKDYTNFIYHKTVYDLPSLGKVLYDNGFDDVKLYDWRKTEHSQFDDHSQAYLCPKGDKENGILISLNVECIKI